MPKLMKSRTAISANVKYGLTAAALTLMPTASSLGMELRIIEDQLILTGHVVDDDTARIQAAVGANPKLRTVILRNSPGGHAPTGYRIGELFREKRFTTAVSGFCNSACSRMYLGGIRRVFTDDYPPGATNVAFHGHYDQEGKVNEPIVASLGLKAWIILHSDGKADASLVERWTRLPLANGYVHFFNPAKVQRNGTSAFMCQGNEPAGERPFKCEKISRTALDLGVATSTELIRSRDQQELRSTVPEAPLPSGFASLSDLDKLPLRHEHGQAEFKRYLDNGSHKAFAISQTHRAWAWNASSVNSVALALRQCVERASEPCRLYAVDEDVVWATR